jgi:hypothetical protein
MSTLRQIDANRRNAKKSTGPRTPQGKAESRLNALQSGLYAQSTIIPGEDPAQLEALTADYFRQYRPANALERGLLDILVDCEWKLRRFRTIEADIFAREVDRIDPDGATEEHVVAEAYQCRKQTFAFLQRRIDSTHRILLRTLDALTRAQAARPEPLAHAVPSPALVSDLPPDQPHAPAIGFVPSFPPAPAARRPNVGFFGASASRFSAEKTAIPGFAERCTVE